jgi:hypothetical protein
MPVKEPKQKFVITREEKQKPDYFIWFLLVSLFLVVCAGISEFEKFTTIDEKGNLQISEKRLNKLHQDTLKFQKSEQYALIALETGYYPCLTCRDTTMILLYKNEVWRYGVTMNGKEVRYSKSTFRNLVYIVEFCGTLQQCLIEERKKIVMYPLLPENLKRSAEKRLGRPPANPYDH